MTVTIREQVKEVMATVAGGRYLSDGITSLVQEKYPDLTHEQVRRALREYGAIRRGVVARRDVVVRGRRVPA